MHFKDRRALRLRTPEDMLAILRSFGNAESEFRPGRTVHAINKMDRDYVYTLTAPVGQEFAEGFRPELTPGEMLAFGVFEGKYLNDCLLEFPREWFIRAIALDKLLQF